MPGNGRDPGRPDAQRARLRGEEHPAGAERRGAPHGAPAVDRGRGGGTRRRALRRTPRRRTAAPPCRRPRSRGATDPRPLLNHRLADVEPDHRDRRRPDDPRGIGAASAADVDDPRARLDQRGHPRHERLRQEHLRRMLVETAPGRPPARCRRRPGSGPCRPDPSRGHPTAGAVRSRHGPVAQLVRAGDS